MAVSFAMYDNRTPMPNGNDENAWRSTLAKLDQSSHVPLSNSRIFVDTFFRHVDDHEILFIKRNEQRFWTRTAAREDAESTLTYLMNQEAIAASGGR